MTAGRTPRETEELRQWAVEQAVEFTRHKEDFGSSASITHIAAKLVDYVTLGRVR
jgi:hypothetical protein